MSQSCTGRAGTVGVSPRDALRALSVRLQLNHHRGLVWISGDSAGVRRNLNDLRADSVGTTFWYGDDAPDKVTVVKARGISDWLGAECNALVFDARNGFEPDAFGALSGTVCGGGVLYLLTPSVDIWSQQPAGSPQRYLQRLATLLAGATDIVWIEDGIVRRVPADSPCPPGDPLPQGTFPGCRPPLVSRQGRDSPCPPGDPLSRQGRDSPCLTRDQEAAVTAVMHVATGHRRRPVVLQSDRGRGKSAAFGIAAARLITEQGKRVLVTAARRAAVDTLIGQATSLLSPEQKTALRFVAPDALLQQPQDTDLLLVDEAAAIPAPLLEQLLRRYSRIAFATTVHGYEGTGRGFALRFNHVLDRFSNSWKRVVLQTPIRWAPDDPLEALVFRLLLLDAGAATDEALGRADTGTACIECIDRDTLLQDETLLRELFGLLVLAHYRTRPSDLRQLLDASNLSIYLLRLNGHVAGAALVAAEGGFEREQAEEITAGMRRPLGHLLPETLAIHLGLVEAPLQRAARIMRIAVHPAVQGRGLGSQLVTHIAAAARREGFDYVGASFGANEPLLRFWKGTGLWPVRISERRSASSGYHSVVVMQALSEQGEALFTHARQRFIRHFPHQLSDSLRELETPLVLALMRDTPEGKQGLTAYDLEDVRRFACERRFLESAIGALWSWLCNRLVSSQSLDGLDAADAELLVARILQKHGWSTCADRAGLTGHDQALVRLRELVRQLMD